MIPQPMEAKVPKARLPAAENKVTNMISKINPFILIVSPMGILVHSVHICFIVVQYILNIHIVSKAFADQMYIAISPLLRK